MPNSIAAADVHTIIFVCEAGIGSSLMGVNSMKKQLKKAGVTGINVIHKPARLVPEDTKIIVCHEGLAKMVQQRIPDAVVVTFKLFLNDPAINGVVAALQKGEDISA